MSTVIPSQSCRETEEGSRQENLPVRAFPQESPAIIFYADGEEIKKLKLHTLGYPHLIDRVASSDIVLVIFVDGFDCIDLTAKARGVLLTDEAVEFKVNPKIWEVEAFFAMLENHKEGEEIEL